MKGVPLKDDFWRLEEEESESYSESVLRLRFRDGGGRDGSLMNLYDMSFRAFQNS